MEKISLLDFFNKIDYNWEKDKDKIEKICYYTKTRVNPDMKKFVFSYGMEQPFVIKAAAEHFKSENFFEMGTGRGTASYSVSLNDTLKEIATVDIVTFTQKQSTAIGYRPALVSNKDIYDRIDGKEKKKIKFFERSQFVSQIVNFKNHFDICFIDGEHDKEAIIFEDVEISQKVSKGDAIYIFDDYCLNRFSVKKVVDKILSDGKYNALLVEMRGHLFDNTKKEKDEGLVILSTRSLF